ncbi:14867_t:CDS:2 [Funneliformis geosporum]|uniref:1600_t:CDS:1 n=1 Tax=Funneliformis geosporum TaxID=1117311 RepID=A0A9W4SNS0_9GLOM|nr:14867_t:CDS:2 [Funneliformis geosporum]CAI2175001.1 1600_t:CDS:2 [Funneliformis geosporum]
MSLRRIILISTTLYLLLPFVLSSGNNPYFDPNIPSCVACEKEYPSIDSCTESNEIFQNASSVLFDPLQFVNAIRCACADTFLSVYPLCIECFRRTGQPDTLLNTEVPPTIETIRGVCQTISATNGNASNYDATATMTPLSPSDRPWMNSANSSKGMLWIISFIVLTSTCMLFLQRLDQ